jgi:hypothetical protein
MLSFEQILLLLMKCYWESIHWIFWIPGGKTVFFIWNKELYSLKARWPSLLVQKYWSLILFGRSSLLTLFEISTTLTENLNGYTRFLQETSRSMSRLGHDQFFRNPFSLILTFSLYALRNFSTYCFASFPTLNFAEVSVSKRVYLYTRLYAVISKNLVFLIHTAVLILNINFIK